MISLKGRSPNKATRSGARRFRRSRNEPSISRASTLARSDSPFTSALIFHLRLLSRPFSKRLESGKRKHQALRPRALLRSTLWGRSSRFAFRLFPSLTCPTRPLTNRQLALETSSSMTPFSTSPSTRRRLFCVNASKTFAPEDDLFCSWPSES